MSDTNEAIAPLRVLLTNSDGVPVWRGTVARLEPSSDAGLAIVARHVAESLPPAPLASWDWTGANVAAAPHFYVRTGTQWFVEGPATSDPPPALRCVPSPGAVAGPLTIELSPSSLPDVYAQGCAAGLVAARSALAEITALVATCEANYRAALKPLTGQQRAALAAEHGLAAEPT